jgi:molecular chaperone DnaJ
VAPHRTFTREGDDLLIEMPIPFAVAALGGEVEVPTLKANASLKIPVGTQSGTTFRVRGYGVRNLRSGQPGDELVTVHIEVPKNLSSKQKKLLEEFDSENEKLRRK